MQKKKKLFRDSNNNTDNNFLLWRNINRGLNKILITAHQVLKDDLSYAN